MKTFQLEYTYREQTTPKRWPASSTVDAKSRAEAKNVTACIGWPIFMNLHLAGKKTKAFWRAEEKHAEKAAAEPMLVVPANTPHHFDIERRRSFAAGWTAGINYLRKLPHENRGE